MQRNKPMMIAFVIVLTPSLKTFPDCIQRLQKWGWAFNSDELKGESDGSEWLENIFSIKVYFVMFRLHFSVLHPHYKPDLSFAACKSSIVRVYPQCCSNCLIFGDIRASFTTFSTLPLFKHLFTKLFLHLPLVPNTPSPRATCRSSSSHLLPK